MSHDGRAVLDFASRKTLVRIGVGFAIAVVILYLVAVGIGTKDLSRAFADAKLRWLAAGCASTCIGLVAWGKAWQVVLEVADIEEPFRKIVVTYFAATFADYVTPFGKVGGGPLIAYVLSTDDRISYHESLASVTTADMLNLLPYFGFAVVGLVGLLIHGGVPRRARLLVGALAGVAVLVAAGAALAWRFRGRVEALLVGTLAPLLDRVPLVDAASVREEVRGFYEEVDRISDSPRNLAYTLIFSVIGWVFFAAPLYLAARTLGVPIHPLVVLFVVPASTVAGVVPTPGGLGGVEFALVGLLVVLTPMTAGVAAGVALVYRVASYWWVVGIGGLATLYEVYRT